MKKNTFITYLLICLCAFLLSACCKVETVRIRSYVVAFGEPTSLRIELTDSNNIALYWTNFSRWTFFQSTGLDGVRYDELAALYNDLSYNRIIEFWGTPPGRSYVSNGIVSIDVRSNRDFDAEHPVGTSLAGFVRLLSVSPIRFIESGYQETFDWCNDYPVDFLRETAIFEDWAPLRQNHFPVNEMLSKLEPDDFRLLGTGDRFPQSSDGLGWFFGFLVFDKKPENLGTHNLTVTIRRTNGRMLSQTIEKTFGGSK